MLIVHEDGRHTLLGTIFYFEHATRELPLDIVLGVAIGGALFFAFPPGHTHAIQARPHLASLAWTTVLIVTLIVIGAAIFAGPPSVVENLLQQHTRSGTALLWGSHWRYHLLERLSLILIVMAIGALFGVITRGPGCTEARAGLIVGAMTVAVYLALTIAFAHGPLSMLQPFVDPQYLGHQAREIMTHALVTVPLGWGGAMLLVRITGTVPLRASRQNSSVSALVLTAILGGVLGVAMIGYVAYAALHANAMSHAQSTSLATLIFPHYFEHALTYLVVPWTGALTFALLARGRRVGPDR